nr:MAG TPA: hypothetical protein [Caudoviricetes sp.]
MPVKAIPQMTAYEKMYNEASSHTGLFDQKQWTYAARKGQADMYLSALRMSDNWNMDEFNKMYNNEFSSTERKLNALYNEAYADRKTKKPREYTTMDGTKRKADMTDYEYTKMLLLERNDYEMNKYNEELAAKIKSENTSFFEKLGKTVASPFLQLGSGVTDILNTLSTAGRAAIDTVAAAAGGGAVGYQDYPVGIRGGDVAKAQLSFLNMLRGKSSFGEYAESTFDAAGNAAKSAGDHFMAYFHDVYTPNTFLSDWAYEMERNSFLMDAQGNLNPVGKVVNGVMFTIGQSLPGMVFGQGAGQYVGALTGSARAASVAATVGSKGAFYGAITMQRVDEAYANMLANDTSVDTGKAILNGVIKSAVEIGVEEGLSLLLKNVTGIDAMFFNKTVSSGKGGLTSAGIRRILLDAGQEGLEETLQDFSTYWVDVAFDAYLKTDYWKNLTKGQASFENLMTSFAMGALTSIVGDAAQLVAKNVSSKVNDQMVKYYDKQLSGDIRLTDAESKQIRAEAEREVAEGSRKLGADRALNPTVVDERITAKTEEALANKRANLEMKRDAAKARGTTRVVVKVNDDGTVVEKALNPIAQYEYDLDMESFIQNIAYVMDNYNGVQAWVNDVLAGKESKSDLDMKTLKTVRDSTTVAAMKAYAAFRMITQVYSGLSQERIDAANQILSQMQEAVKQKNLDKGIKYHESLLLTKEMLSQLRGIQADTADKIANHLAKSGSQAKTVINADSDPADFDGDDSPITKETYEKLKNLVKDDSVENVVVADKDTDTKIIDNTLVVDEATAESATPMEIMKAAAESHLVETVQNMDYAVRERATVLGAYRNMRGDDSLTEEEAFQALLFDKKFFRLMLFTYGNRDMYKFLRSLSDMTLEEVHNTKDRATVAKLNDILTSMRTALTDYATNIPQVNVEEIVELYPAKQQNSIREHIMRGRWMWDVKQKILDGTMTDDDRTLIRTVIGNLPNINANKKTELIRQIDSGAPSQRLAAVKLLDLATDNVWNHGYDGTLYLKPISLANNIFNAYLQANNLTLKNWLDDSNISQGTRDLMKITGMDMISWHKERFNAFAPKYTFDFQDGALTVYGKRQVIEGFSGYIGELAAAEKERKFDDRRVSRLKGKSTAEIKKLLSDKVDVGTASYVTVNDLIANPRLLNDDIRKKITEKYHSVNQDTVRTYLATDYFPNLYPDKLLTVAELQDGTYVLAEGTNMLNMYKKNVKWDFQPDTSYPLSKFMKTSVLPGVMKDTVVQFTDDVSAGADGEFVGYQQPAKGFQNVIKLSNNLLDEGIKYQKFILAHEVQHCYQTINFMNNGGGNVLSSVKDPRFDKLVAEIKVHAPEVIMKSDGTFYTQKSELLRRINTFLYHATAEYDANGFAGSPAIKFTPVISAYEYNKGVLQHVIKLSWGTVLVDEINSTFSPQYKSMEKRDSNWEVDNRTHSVSLVKRDGATITLKDNVTGKEISLKPDEFGSSLAENIASAIDENSTLQDVIDVSEKMFWDSVTTSSDGARRYLTLREDFSNEVTQRELIDLARNNTEARTLSKLSLYLGSGQFLNPDMTFEKYLQTTVPIVRVQYGDKVYRTDVVGFKVIDTQTYDNFISENSQVIQDFASENADGDEASLFYGEIKVDDIYLANDDGNILIPSDKAADFDKIDVELNVQDDYETRTIQTAQAKRIDENKEEKTRRSYSTGKSLSSGAEWVQLKDGRWKKTTLARKYQNYVKKVEYFTEKNGNPATTRIGNARYYYKEKPKGRAVSKGKTEGTDLKYFKKPGKRLQMPISLQNFIITAKEKSVDPAFIEKISGDEKGTLTTHNVMYYFATDGDKIGDDVLENLGREGIDDATFSAINDAFFQNEYITTDKQLDDMVRQFAMYGAVRDILVDVDRKLLTTTNKDTQDAAIELVTEDPKFKTRFTELQNKYSATAPNQYMRKALMIRYDGTLDSIASVAKTADWLAHTEYDVTYGSVGTDDSFDKKTSSHEKSNKTGHDVIPDKDSDYASGEDEYDTNDETKARGAIKKTYNPRYIDDDALTRTDLTDLELETKRKLISNMIESADDVGLAKLLVANDFAKSMDEAMSYIASLDAKALQYGLMQKLLRYTESEVDAFLVKFTNALASTQGETYTELSSDKLANSINYTLNRVVNTRLNRDQKKLLGKQHPDLFDKNGNFRNELRYDEKGHLKSAEELNELDKKLRVVRTEIKNGVYADKETLKRFNKFLDKQTKQLEDSMKAKTEKIPATEQTINAKPHTVKISNEQIYVSTDRDMPELIKQVLNTEFTRTEKTNVTYLSAENEEHVVASVKEILTQNAELLNGMDSVTANDIVDYYLHTSIIPETNRAKLYITVENTMLACIIELANKGAITLTPENDKGVRERVELSASLHATGLRVFQSVMKKLNPVITIQNALMMSLDLDRKDPEVIAATEKMANYIVTGNPLEIGKAADEFYEFASKRAKYKASFTEKWLMWQRAAMLSGPGTWVRNWETNIGIGGLNIKGKTIIPGLNQVNDGIIKGLSETDNAIAKLFQLIFKTDKNEVTYVDVKTPEGLKDTLGETHKVPQYNLPVIKASQRSIDFVQDNVVKSGLLNLIKDGAMKYTEPGKNAAAGSGISQLIIDSTYMRLQRELGFYKYDKKTGERVKKEAGKVGKDGDEYVKTVLGHVQGFVYHMLSDDPWVDRRFSEVLAKTLTADNVDLTHGITDEVANHIVDAYSFAASEYMHKDNIVFYLERKARTYLQKKVGMKRANELWWAYKQFFPFAGAGFNWAVEGLQFTPVALGINIHKLNHLESTIGRLEEAQAKGIDVKNIKFQKYVLQKRITKGIVGTIGMIAAAILVAVGAISLKDDDKNGATIMIGDNYGIDISDLYMSNGFMLGLSMADSIKKNVKTDGKLDVWNAIVDFFGNSLSEALHQFGIADLYNSFRYADSFGDAIMNQVVRIPNTMVPNMWKMFVNIAKTHNLKFASDFEGRVYKYLSDVVPLLGNRTGTQIDPYTGKAQIKYLDSEFGTVLINAFNKAQTVKIYPNTVSASEKEAVRLGITKTALTGRYDVNGKKITLSTSGLRRVNTFYGQLNDTDLNNLFDDKTRYIVENENGRRVSKKYSQMTDKEKNSVIKRIMSNNATISKIYELTQNQGYTYYASEEQYKRLVALGIRKNIYRSTGKLQGFVKK